MSAFKQDLKLALRNITSRPGFSLLVTGMLALGIAGNVAIFSIYDGLFLRPLPLREPDRLVDLNEIAPKWNLTFVSVSTKDSFAWRKATSFESMVFFKDQSFNLSSKGPARRLRAAGISGSMLNALRLKPVVGRDFLPEEDRPGGPKVVLLGYQVWREQFAGDRSIAGTIVKLDSEPYTVVGVLPREAMLPLGAEAWVPLALDPNGGQAGYHLNGLGRLKPGATIERARAELMAIHRGLVDQGEKANAITSPRVTPLGEQMLGDFRPAGNILLGAVGVVLLIACANIAGLMMVRASGRSREMAIRTALGASRGAIFRQLLTESLLYAALGGAAGLWCGRLLLRALISALPPHPITPWLAFSLDWRALLFAFALTSAAAVLFGLAPALQASRTDLRGALHESARSSSSGGRRRALGGLVVGEIALATLLLVTASLLYQALRNAMRVDSGFRADNVLTFGVSMPEAKYGKDEQKVAFSNALMERLRTIPGVRAAGAAQVTPMTGHWGIFFTAEGARPLGPNEQDPVVLQVICTPSYPEALGVTFLGGRRFNERDGEGSHRVAVVNQSFAKRFFPNTDPIGKRIRYPWKKDEWIEIIGLTRDVKHYGLDQEMRPSVFVPYRQWPWANLTVMLRSSRDPAALTGPAREALRQIDADLPRYDVVQLRETVDRSLWTRRASSTLAATFAALAVLLAAGGIYGVISYAVSRRTREIGIRMALGAAPGRVLRQILGHGLLLLSIGVPLGILATLGVSSALAKLLFGVQARDPWTYSLAAAGVALIALAANLIPARRAATIAPSEALRTE